MTTICIVLLSVLLSVAIEDYFCRCRMKIICDAVRKLCDYNEALAKRLENKKEK